MNASKTHWPSIVILIILGFGILVFLGAGFATGITSISGLFDKKADPAGDMIQSFASGFEMLVLFICGWFVLQKTMQQERAESSLRFPFQIWQVLVIPVIVLICLGIGAAVAVADIKWLSWFTLPTLTVIGIVLPIIFFLGIGTNGIQFGPRWRAFSVLGMGMTLGPLIMITLELIVLIFFIIIAAIFLASQPQVIGNLNQIRQSLKQGLDQEAMLKLLIPYITKPAVIASVFIYLSLIVPLIEELFKPLAVWLFVGGIKLPSNGFALGMLSGGAFALMESLGVSSNGSASWPVIVGVRAGTSLLHMTTAGLMGHAIVLLVRQKKIAPFLLTYLVAVTLHGLWNACAAGVSFSALAEYTNKPEWLWYIPAEVCGIGLLACGMLAVLIIANRKIRATIVLPAEQKDEKEGVQ